ncbi:glycerophosphodiester phosphodiesterase [Ottowia testudinis]|uniref:Glycerophosphodiester phosphodiesterase n=1 Tax=Ottowia testudinis TaxID=2816950 RepID=A0A975H311_9BURK|nr:glycerophosphodiester phosphodiesterase [Ottowia testudinis]QTD44761.1 glycerophosphodiester phosphodiesterase [Ottowia testudinis]
MTNWPYPFWIAHRGAGRLAPENTLAAFRLGAAHGYRMAECDVKLSADGVPFLLHDATLERTTQDAGTAGELPWAALAQLDAGGWHSRQYAGEPIPTLQNLARWCLANGQMLDIEIKPTPGLEEKTGQVVAELAGHLWQGAAVPPLLTSFRPESLQGAWRAAPQLPRGLLLDTLWDGWLDIAKQLKCAAIVCNHALWDTALVERVHRLGLRALSYTVNDEWAAERLIGLGTDGIVTDRVDLFSPV